MDLFTPVRFGLHVATDAVKLATLVPRLILHQLTSGDHDDQQRFTPTGDEPADTGPVATRPAARTRPAAPGAAAAAGAPDPTAASSATRARRTVPQGERRASDVRPPRTTRARKRTEPKRSQVDRQRVEQREQVETPETTLAETEGAAAPGATIRVDEPWDGYGQMKAPDIVDRVSAGDPATKAVVRLYEQTHKKRKSILDATAS